MMLKRKKKSPKKNKAPIEPMEDFEANIDDHKTQLEVR
jgi:hypothetical protein